MSDALLPRLTTSPDVYLQKIDLARESALLVQFEQGAYAAASFLDDRILTPATKGGWAPLVHVAQAAQCVSNPRPLHFIFHTGHVGSTLISRLLDETGAVLSLREPLPLRTLADAQDALGLPESLLSDPQFDALRQTLVQTWRRGYTDTRAVILKATSSTGRVAGSLLQSLPASRAVLLNLALEPYLATLLAGGNASIDLRGHGPERHRRVRSQINAPVAPLHALTLGPLAAMSWLAETLSQHAAAALVCERVIAVDFDHFLSHVEGGMRRILEHFDLPRDEAYLSNVAQSPVLARYSKAAEFAYTPAMRAEILNESRRRNAAEIRAGVEWVESLARQDCAVALTLNAASRR